MLEPDLVTWVLRSGTEDFHEVVAAVAVIGESIHDITSRDSTNFGVTKKRNNNVNFAASMILLSRTGDKITANR